MPKLSKMVITINFNGNLSHLCSVITHLLVLCTYLKTLFSPNIFCLICEIHVVKNYLNLHYQLILKTYPTLATNGAVTW